MNIALIFAGGAGQRMNAKSRPKQFLELHGKPIIIYTLEQFDRHPRIDSIVVVCIEGWHEHLRQTLAKFGIQKVTRIVGGGSCGQASIWNGLQAIHENFPEDSIVLIHDGVRPLITQQLLTDNIDCVKKNGNAISVAPAVETMAVTTGGSKVGQIIERDRCRLAKAPQSFYLRDIYAVHEKAIAANDYDAIDSASLMQKYGYALHTVETATDNIKITTPLDFFLFRAILDAKENTQIFGV